MAEPGRSATYPAQLVHHDITPARGAGVLTHPLHPLQAIFLACALPLFIGVLLCDFAYASTFHVQWKNFASWLLVGGLAVSLVTMVWAISDLVRLVQDRGARRMLYAASLVATWLLGFINVLVHARDVWASMPEGLVFSIIVVLLSVIAIWLGFSNYSVHRPRVPA